MGKGDLLSLEVSLDFDENDHSSGSTRCGKRNSTGLLKTIPTGPSIQIGDSRVSPGERERR